jgi:Cu/Ag efflux pump CusA
VVIGGVLSSTLLTLLVLPVLYHFFGPAMKTLRY